MISGRDPRQFDRLELAALGYLLAPMLLFVANWWQWPVALGLGGLLAFTAGSVARQSRGAGAPLGLALWSVLAVVALLWVGSSGLLGGLPLNEDWSVRMVVLRDLTVGAWPVGYGPLAGGESMLRFSMGYYLLPAGLGAALGGVETARLLLGLWTALGVLLFFALVVQCWSNRRPRAVAGLLLILAFFSGMDILGFLLGQAYTPALGEHIEWWTPWLQYSSQTTLLFWAPNHALPAWLGVALIWRHREGGLALAPAALLLLAAALWSPLACVGLLPLLALATLRQRSWQEWLQELLRPAVLATLPPLALLAVFVSFGIVTELLPTGRRELAEIVVAQANWYQWLCFELLEWGLLACALLAGVRRPLGWTFWAACALLVLLPLLRFGPGNDLVMRAGIAPVTLLLLCAADALARPGWVGRWRVAVLAILLVGSVTPLQELLRQTQEGSRWPDKGRSMARYEGHAWHYVGALREGWLARLLRSPVRLP